MKKNKQKEFIKDDMPSKHKMRTQINSLENDYQK